MDREEFFTIINKFGFKYTEVQNEYGERVFQTKLKNDGWMDGYDYRYILKFAPTFGIKFTIDKKSIGGFTGNKEIEERLFSGIIDKEEDFSTVLKCIKFNQNT